MAQEPFRQSLPDLALSIERYTDAVPPDGGWYLIRDGERLDRFRSYKAARAAWDQVVAESGWKPPKRELDAHAAIRREAGERWSRNRGG